MKDDVQEHLGRAGELLRAAHDLLRLDYPDDSISRSYYAMFHAATAVLLELDIRRSSHHAVWAAFGQFVTARGLMDVRHHHVGLRLFADRSRSDYLARPGGTQEDAERNLRAAGDFVAACETLLASREHG